MHNVGSNSHIIWHLNESPVKADPRNDGFINKIIDYDVPVVVLFAPKLIISDDTLQTMAAER